MLSCAIMKFQKRFLNKFGSSYGYKFGTYFSKHINDHVRRKVVHYIKSKNIKCLFLFKRFIDNGFGNKKDVRTRIKEFSKLRETSL